MSHPQVLGQRVFSRYRITDEAMRIHLGEIRRDLGSEGHAIKDLTLYVDARRGLDKCQAILRQPEHGALGDVDDRLAVFQGGGPRERHLSHMVDELRDATVARDLE